MFEECGVVAAWRQYDSNAAVVVHVVHHLAQQVGIVAVVGNIVCRKGVRRHLACYPSRHHRIACSRRNTQIVLQYIPLPVLSFHKVDARDVRINASFRADALAHWHISFGRIYEFLWHHSVFHYAFVVIDVPKKHVKSLYTLFKSSLKVVPIFLADDARDGVEREQLFVEHSFFVNTETYSKPFEHLVYGVPAVG